jgi:hypothetical protein
MARTQRPATPAATAGVAEAEQPGFDAHASRDKQLAHLEDALLALVGRHQIRQHNPRRDEPEPLRRVLTTSAEVVSEIVVPGHT